MKVKVLIITGYGINAEKELKWAFDLAGGQADIMHLEDLIDKKQVMANYQILAIPGGFSFGDHIASGKVFAAIIQHNLMDEMKKFIDAGKLIIGICNGFQILTRLGLLPSTDGSGSREVSLVENDSGCFENRWVQVKIAETDSPWLKGLDTLYLPVRHGEGRLITKNQEVLNKIREKKLVAMRYINPGDLPGKVEYPFNPNGAVDDIAGLTAGTGLILGLMPHPEAYIFPENHPRWTEKIREKHTGLDIFKNGIKYFYE